MVSIVYLILLSLTSLLRSFQLQFLSKQYIWRIITSCFFFFPHYLLPNTSYHTKPRLENGSEEADSELFPYSCFILSTQMPLIQESSEWRTAVSTATRPGDTAPLIGVRYPIDYSAEPETLRASFVHQHNELLQNGESACFFFSPLSFFFSSQDACLHILEIRIWDIGLNYTKISGLRIFL